LTAQVFSCRFPLGPILGSNGGSKGGHRRNGCQRNAVEGEPPLDTVVWMARYFPGVREPRPTGWRASRRACAVAIVLVSALVSSACLPSRRDKWRGPEEAALRFDRPRREVATVDERWMMLREHDRSYLLHAFDVERRRVKQRCGTILPETFAIGWDELLASGLLDPGEDLRFTPRPGEPPFVGRFQAAFVYQGRRIEARRPLVAAQARALERVLHNWEAALRIEEQQALPALMRAEARMGGCDMQRPDDDYMADELE
jgi:hypothetical protein